MFVVVRNDEDQYSIWPEHRPAPAGWQPVGVAGAPDDCLAHIERVWTDLRPRSSRRPETGPVRAVHDTDRLRLRQVLPAEMSCRLVDGHRHESWAPAYSPSLTRRQDQALLAEADGSQRPQPVVYEILLTATGRVIGDLGYRSATPGVCEIWYALEPLSRGHGYAAEAVDALTDRPTGDRHRPERRSPGNDVATAEGRLTWLTQRSCPGRRGSPPTARSRRGPSRNS
jgi:MbtH protein